MKISDQNHILRKVREQIHTWVIASQNISFGTQLTNISMIFRTLLVSKNSFSGCISAQIAVSCLKTRLSFTSWRFNIIYNFFSFCTLQFGRSLTYLIIRIWITRKRSVLAFNLRKIIAQKGCDILENKHARGAIDLPWTGNS